MDKNNVNKNIDTEEDMSGDKIYQPFNPSAIKMDTQTVNLGYLLEMLQYNEINLIPDFQRSDNLWNPQQKSRLIESILLGLPLPSFYFYTETEEPNKGKLAVIDGLQRLGTLKSFIFEEDIQKKLRLNDLEFLTEYNDKIYEDLSREDKRRISGLKITLNIIQPPTPDNVKYIIFRRVNTAGLQLTPQEMRHALNQGTPAKFLKELAQSEAFLKATSGSISTKRMDDRDYINRFIAFYLIDYQKNYEGELDLFLNAGMAKIYDLNEDELDHIRYHFKKSMNIAFEIFGRYAFRKRYDINDIRKYPISKAVFDTLSVNLAKLNERESDALLMKRKIFEAALINLFNDNEFNTAITSGTGKKSSINIRFTYVQKLIEEILYHDN